MSKKIIYCPLVGYTQWESTLLQIIDTPEFQRLRSIKQTGTVHWVFPGATHTRFEHSLGVAHFAERFAEALKSRQPDLDLDPFVFKLAGLCHDMGHGPLSHAYDVHVSQLSDVPESLASHEERSVALLRHVVSKYQIQISEYVLRVACELIMPREHSLERFWYQIVASHIDVDKFDYIRRDCARTGLPLDIDVSRFIEYARIVDRQICYPMKMTFDINNIFMVRHQLHAQVYQNPVVRAIEHMHLDILRLLGKCVAFRDLDEFVTLTDVVFTRSYIMAMHREGKVTSQDTNSAIYLLERIERRDLYKLVADVPCADVELNYRDHPSAVVDVVHIGYSENPLFQVYFYDKENKTRKLHTEDMSSAFPVECEDVRMRIYSKTASQIGAVKAWINEAMPELSLS